MKNSTKLFTLLKIGLVIFLLQAVLQYSAFLITDQIIWAYQRMVGTYTASWGSVFAYIFFIFLFVPHLIIFLLLSFFTKLNHFLITFILNGLAFAPFIYTSMEYIINNNINAPNSVHEIDPVLKIPAMILANLLVYLLLKNTRFNQNNSEEN